MSFCFQCLECHAAIRIRSDMAGITMSCPACGELLETPLSVDDDTAAAQQGLDEATEVPTNTPLPEATSADDGRVGFGGRDTGEDGELDMTPMVDVTFLLLIFFMVSASFVLQRSLETPVPSESKPSTQARPVDELEREYIIVRIDELDTWFVGAPGWDEEQEAPSKQELFVKIRQARQGGHNKMLVMAHGEATHGRVVTALDAGTAMKMDEVKLITVEEQ